MNVWVFFLILLSGAAILGRSDIPAWWVIVYVIVAVAALVSSWRAYAPAQQRGVIPLRHVALDAVNLSHQDCSS